MGKRKRRRPSASLFTRSPSLWESRSLGRGSGIFLKPVSQGTYSPRFLSDAHIRAVNTRSCLFHRLYQQTLKQHADILKRINRRRGCQAIFDISHHSFSSPIVIVVITGRSEASLGAEAAKALAHGRPKEIILAGRTESKVRPVMTEIAQINASIQTRFVSLDFSDLGSVRKAAKEINDCVSKVDILICSAGIMGLEKYTKSKEGYELQFASCHLGHFLFDRLVVGKVGSCAGGESHQFDEHGLRGIGRQRRLEFLGQCFLCVWVLRLI